MRDTRFENRSSEWVGDMTVWLRANAGDNGEQVARLRRNLRLARERFSVQFARRFPLVFSSKPRIIEHRELSYYILSWKTGCGPREETI